MNNEDMKKLIETYKFLQTIPALNMPCPRCGKNKLEPDFTDNCLSRHEDIYICTECGRDEAGLDFVGQAKPLDKWYAVRFLNGDVGPYERKTPEGIAPYYWVNAHVTAKVTDQDMIVLQGFRKNWLMILWSVCCINVHKSRIIIQNWSGGDVRTF